MAFRLRQTDGADFTSGTWIAEEGGTDALGDGAVVAEPLATTPVAGRDVPTRWRLEVPARDVRVVVEALNPSAWMNTAVPYWEGPVTVSGSHDGRGYLEMTGYD